MNYFLKASTPDGETHTFELSPHAHVVGRTSSKEPPNKLSVPGDPSLSRQQFEVQLENGRLRVTPYMGSRNETAFRGLLDPGGRFMAARTEFIFYTLKPEPKPEPETPKHTEFTLCHTSRHELRQGKAERCLDIMNTFFPRLRKAESTDDLWKATYDLVHELLPKTRVAIIDNGEPTGDVVQPSRKLLSRAAEIEQTILHLWDGTAEFTRALGTDWAIAVPIPGSVVLYAEGKDTSLSPGSEERILLDLVGEIVSHHLMWRRLEQVGRFLSPTIRDMVYGPEFEKILRPRIADVTVLFFDLRWSSKALEQQDLAVYHKELTDLMTSLTDCVFAEEGTVIDYVGDAVLACWGAPLPQNDHAHRAVRAARAMHEVCTKLGKGCGVGLASGQAMAGQVGARGQVKYGLVGSVTNVAARLEGLTKMLRAPILVSDETRQFQPPGQFRKLLPVRPAGMDNYVTIHELVLPKELGGCGLNEAECEAFESGTWSQDDPVVQALKAMGVTDPKATLEVFHK